MTKDEHAINRNRESDTEERYTCEECGATFDTEDRLRTHREREIRSTLRGSPLGDAILGVDEARRKWG